MSARAAFWLIFVMGCFLTGFGMYVVGPFLIVWSLFYYRRFVRRPTGDGEEP